jgi:hypothetical protein
LLVVVDAPAPGSAPDLVTRAGARLEQIRAGAPSGQLQRIVAVGARVGRSGARWVSSYVRNRVALGTAGLVPRRGLDQYNFFVAINADMAIHYEPTATFGGPALLIRSTIAGPTLLPDVDDVVMPDRAGGTSGGRTMSADRSRSSTSRPTTSASCDNQSWSRQVITSRAR